MVQVLDDLMEGAVVTMVMQSNQVTASLKYMLQFTLTILMSIKKKLLLSYPVAIRSSEYGTDYQHIGNLHLKLLLRDWPMQAFR